MYYTARKLVAAHRAARNGYSIRTGVWTNPVLKPDEFRRWFLDCLFEKINSHDPLCCRGRKSQYEYRVALMRMRMYIGNRIVIDWIDPVLGPRIREAFAHRMRDPFDYC